MNSNFVLKPTETETSASCNPVGLSLSIPGLEKWKLSLWCGFSLDKGSYLPCSPSGQSKSQQRARGFLPALPPFSSKQISANVGLGGGDGEAHTGWSVTSVLQKSNELWKRGAPPWDKGSEMCCGGAFRNGKPLLIVTSAAHATGKHVIIKSFWASFWFKQKLKGQKLWNMHFHQRRPLYKLFIYLLAVKMAVLNYTGSVNTEKSGGVFHDLTSISTLSSFFAMMQASAGCSWKWYLFKRWYF